MNIDMIKDKFKIIISKIKKLDRDYIIIGIIIISVITFMVLNIGKVKEFEEKETTGNIEKNITVSEESKDNKEKEGNEEDKKENISSETGIFVHIDGYVNNPGVYQIKENERTNVLIEKAGGLKNGYSIKNINLAAKLSDGDKVYIPSIEEEKTLGNQNNNISVNTVGKHTNNGNNSNNNVNITKNNKININTANVSELKQITGIGESTANKIIDYRQNVGKFKKIEDIKEVKGIGDSKFESLKNKITI
jgi:competence protein comEA helix-hairpin-helix repeat region